MINFSPEVYGKLMTIANACAPQEFSGFGFCKVNGQTFEVYDFELLNVGSYGYTEIPTEKIVALLSRKDASNMKVWIHRHPVGNGIPGEHNWSMRDQQTIVETPLGGLPEMVLWSVSCVLTPHGWVGRFDNHLKKTTVHQQVEPSFPETYIQTHLLFKDYLECRVSDEEEYEMSDNFDEAIAMAEESVDQLTENEIQKFAMTREDIIELILESKGLTEDYLREY